MAKLSKNLTYRNVLLVINNKKTEQEKLQLSYETGTLNQQIRRPLHVTQATTTASCCYMYIHVVTCYHVGHLTTSVAHRSRQTKKL